MVTRATRHPRLKTTKNLSKLRRWSLMTIIEQWLEHLPVPFVHQAGAVPFGSFRCQGTRLEGNRSPLVAEWFLQAWSALVTFQDMPSFMHFESFWHMFCHSLMHWHCRFETWKIDYGASRSARRESETSRFSNRYHGPPCVPGWRCWQNLCAARRPGIVYIGIL